jgi:predicted nucleic acid-binding protein
MVVISDTSVISNLIEVDLLYILPKLYHTIIIPQAVNAELKGYSAELADARRDGWLEERTVVGEKFVAQLLTRLDKGEAEAIALAKELNADLLIIDEKKGRKIAVQEGLSIIGLIGVLIDAKAERLITEVKPVLNKLVYEVGFHISPKLYKYTLSLANE